jgi:hypothetical protein
MTGFEVHRRSGPNFPVDNRELAPHDYGDANDIPKEGDSQIVGRRSPVASEYKRGVNEACRVTVNFAERGTRSPWATSRLRRPLVPRVPPAIRAFDGPAMRNVLSIRTVFISNGLLVSAGVLVETRQRRTTDSHGAFLMIEYYMVSRETKAGEVSKGNISAIRIYNHCRMTTSSLSPRNISGQWCFMTTCPKPDAWQIPLSHILSPPPAGVEPLFAAYVFGQTCFGC